MFSKVLLSKVLGKNLYFNQVGLFKCVKYGFAFPTQPSDYANLKKLANIMNTKQLDINEEIDYEGNVRLINTNNKQLGVMPFEEAFQKAKDMNLDIVLVNSQTNPAICKTVNYKEEIYSKFAKEVISQEAEARKVDSKKPKKQIQISINISSADLRTKTQICKDLSKKNPQIKVFIQTNDAQEDQGKNILYTFKDLVKEELVSEHDLIVRSLIKDELDSEDIFNDKKATKQIELHLQTIEFNQTQTNYSAEQIKKLVDQYLRELGGNKKEDLATEELKRTSKTLKSLESFEGSSKLLVSEKSLEEQIGEFAKDIKDEEEDERSDQYLKVLEEISKRQKRSIHEIQDEIDSLKYRLQTSKEQALVLSLLQKEEKRLRDYKRTLKLAKAVRNY